MQKYSDIFKILLQDFQEKLHDSHIAILTGNKKTQHGANHSPNCREKLIVHTHISSQMIINNQYKLMNFAEIKTYLTYFSRTKKLQTLQN